MNDSKTSLILTVIIVLGFVSGQAFIYAITPNSGSSSSSTNSINQETQKLTYDLTIISMVGKDVKSDFCGELIDLYHNYYCIPSSKVTKWDVFSVPLTYFCLLNKSLVSALIILNNITYLSQVSFAEFMNNNRKNPE